MTVCRRMWWWYPAALLLAVNLAPAALVTEKSDSIFSVDGLMVDSSEEEEKDAVPDSKFYQIEMKRFPMPLQNRRPGMPSGSAGAEKQGVSSVPRDVVMKYANDADSFARQQDWNRALNEVQRGLELAPEDMTLLRKAAAYAALARRFAVADEYFARVLKAYPESVPFLTGRAGVLIRLLKLQDADAVLRKAFEIEPNYLTAKFNYLCLQIARGDQRLVPGPWETLNTEELISMINWLDADRVDYIMALKEEGYALLCDVTLGKGTSVHVGDIAGDLKQVRAALSGGNWAKAEADIRRLMGLGVQAMGLRMDLARCRFEQGDRDSALTILKDAADRHQGISSVQYNYAFVLMDLERYGEAATVLELARQLDPNDGQTGFALACAYAGQNLMDKAWPILTRLAQTHPEQMGFWMKGDQPYLKAIRGHPDYARTIQRQIGNP